MSIRLAAAVATGGRKNRKNLEKNKNMANLNGWPNFFYMLLYFNDKEFLSWKIYPAPF